MKNSNDTTGSGTRDLTVCSAVRQPNGPRCNIKVLRVPNISMKKAKCITYSECVSVDLVIHHTTPMSHLVIRSIFFTLFRKGHDFLRKRY